MIYIDLSSFKPNDDWRYEAWNLYQDLLRTPDKQKFIDDNKNFWGQIKNTMPLSHKCWFSEEITGTFAYQIEHFRPKDGVKRIGDRNPIKRGIKYFDEEIRIGWTNSNPLSKESYWWLAFYYKNFRIVAGLINSKKGNFFPIKNGCSIAYTPTNNINLEEHILLDPTKENDPELLTFDHYGEAIPTEKDITKYEYIRAFVSINIYGLNSYSTLTQKRMTKWKDCEQLISDIEKIIYPRVKPLIAMIRNIETTEDEDYLNKFDEKCEKLRQNISNNSEFASVGRACLNSFNYEWIKTEILDMP